MIARIKNRIETLTNHIRLVQTNCLLVGQYLMEHHADQLGRQLIARGFRHDASKFYGHEWDGIYNQGECSNETECTLERTATAHHRLTNDHHPEFWGGINLMPEIAVAEMVCDQFAHSQAEEYSFGEWFSLKAMDGYGLVLDSQQYHIFKKYMRILEKAAKNV